MNGFHICEELRKEPQTRGIPIIVVSGSWKSAEDRIRSIEAGADDFLTKPFDAQELMARIKRMLQRKKVDMGHNPLTGLPGNLAIEEETRRRLARKIQSCLCLYRFGQFQILQRCVWHSAGRQSNTSFR